MVFTSSYSERPWSPLISRRADAPLSYSSMPFSSLSAIAERLGLDAYGVAAADISYQGATYRSLREAAARGKDFPLSYSSMPFSSLSASIRLGLPSSCTLQPSTRIRIIYYGNMSSGSVLLNVLWILLCGIELAVASVMMGIICCLTIIGIPFGLQHFKFAALALPEPSTARKAARQKESTKCCLKPEILSFFSLIPVKLNGWNWGF